MTARFDVRVSVEVEDQAAADRLERVLGDALAGLLQFRPAVTVTCNAPRCWNSVLTTSRATQTMVWDTQAGWTAT